MGTSTLCDYSSKVLQEYEKQSRLEIYHRIAPVVIDDFYDLLGVTHTASEQKEEKGLAGASTQEISELLEEGYGVLPKKIDVCCCLQ